MVKVLDNKVAVVTGGNAGIGREIARAYRAEGARVFVAGRRQDELDRVEAEFGPEVTGVRCDVGRLGDLDALYATVSLFQPDQRASASGDREGCSATALTRIRE
ncbi:SDR family NAD(P)-dependent oxidoreductase [Pseudonocardia sp. HH130629-09]|uniref:SDR family NAD(P)-dependent oxidoreductase n=1 Tax=Pseudonocardia sp. HH130629-09 TaxID=1641402 RepID=UPI000A48DE52|nr:SDR family NAD(P)-dependent oxidoreductase [Pseudonocardia sp. HH130629-09]